MCPPGELSPDQYLWYWEEGFDDGRFPDCVLSRGRVRIDGRWGWVMPEHAERLGVSCDEGGGTLEELVRARDAVLLDVVMPDDDDD